MCAIMLGWTSEDGSKESLAHVCMLVCMYLYMYMYVCMYACMYVCMYVCTYVCIVDFSLHSI